MGSKFIPKKNKPQINNYRSKLIPGETWSNYIDNSSPEDAKKFKEAEAIEKAEQKAHVKHLSDTKKRIESMDLDKVTFTDLYELPFRKNKVIDWVYDKNGNFCFQFENVSKDDVERIISYLNGEANSSIVLKKDVKYKDGEIFVKNEFEKWIHIITIRGWGNLTGIGAYNLDGKYAAKIQDTLGEWLTKQISTNEI